MNIIDFHYRGRRQDGALLAMIMLVLALVLVALFLKGDFHERGNAPNYTDWQLMGEGDRAGR